jgi:hypothetical protein
MQRTHQQADGVITGCQRHNTTPNAKGVKALFGTTLLT